MSGANFSKDVLGLKVTKIRKDKTVDALRADVDKICDEMGVDVADEWLGNNQVVGHLFFVDQAVLTIVHNKKFRRIISVPITVAQVMRHMKGAHLCFFDTVLIEKSPQLFKDFDVFGARQEKGGNGFHGCTRIVFSLGSAKPEEKRKSAASAAIVE